MTGIQLSLGSHICLIILLAVHFNASIAGSVALGMAYLHLNSLMGKSPRHRTKVMGSAIRYNTPKDSHFLPS
jgi:hypothetical protein